MKDRIYVVQTRIGPLDYDANTDLVGVADSPEGARELVIGYYTEWDEECGLDDCPGLNVFAIRLNEYVYQKV